MVTKAMKRCVVLIAIGLVSTGCSRGSGDGSSATPATPPATQDDDQSSAGEEAPPPTAESPTEDGPAPEGIDDGHVPEKQVQRWKDDGGAVIVPPE